MLTGGAPPVGEPNPDPSSPFHRLLRKPGRAYANCSDSVEPAIAPVLASPFDSVSSTMSK